MDHLHERSCTITVLVYLFVTISNSTATFYTNHWALQTSSKTREVDGIALRHGFVNLGKIEGFDDCYHFLRSNQTATSTTQEEKVTRELLNEPQVVWAEQQVLQQIVSAAFQTPKDPYFHKQWHLINEGQMGGPKGLDINVLPVWKQGFTGKGVVVAVLDTGIYHNHPDLKSNYRPDVSYDLVDYDPDPFPPADTLQSAHGTLVAGAIAASNNSVCGVGVAYEASFGGVRLPFDSFTDIVAATALTFGLTKVDIYSCSWAISNNGKTLGGPQRLTRQKLQTGTQVGRGGLGAIYVFSAGNGGGYDDDCNCDGYQNSIYTISITAVSGNGTKPRYTEHCSAILAASYSKDHALNEWDYRPGIYSTDVNGTCGELGETSAAAPLASGIIALTLQANPLLSWRDVQHIVVRTAKIINHEHGDWELNGAGRYVSHAFGYGVLDAEAVVGVAKNWKRVPEQHVCIKGYEKTLPRSLANGDRIGIKLRTSGCRGTADEIRSLEHVVARITLSASTRSHVAIRLTSPRGTTSQLLRHRVHDNSSDGFTDWPFMTVFHWGEDPSGQWKLEIIGKRGRSKITLESWDLVLYGTKEAPYDNSTCHTECMSGCSGPGPDRCYGCLHFKTAVDRHNYTCVATCPSHLYTLFTKNGRNVTCSTTCGVGQHAERTQQENAPLVCKTCPTGCALCRSKRHCFKCEDGWYMLTYSTGGLKHYQQCVRYCWESYYLDKKKKSCQRCSSNCSSCDGPKDNDCQSCSYPKVLHEQRCHDACPHNLYPLKREHNTPICVANCSDFVGYYFDKLTSRCRACNALCASCHNESSYGCIKCRSRYYMLNGRCYFYCPPGYKMSKSTNGKMCKYCGHQRSLCSQTSIVSQQLDTDCPLGTFRQANMPRRLACVRRCRDGYYANKETRFCTKCDRSCSKCFSATYCTRCRTSYFLYGTTCVSKCPLGYFKEHTNGLRRCLPCEPDCQRCDDSRNCTWCRQQCSSCRRRCEECRSPGSKCVRCSDRYYLHRSRCSIHCPQGYYKNASTWTCDRCHSSCLSCFGPTSSHCTSCNDGRPPHVNRCLPSCPSHLFRQSTSNETRAVCVATCRRGTYGNMKTSDCTPCHRLCSACFGSRSSDCTACKLPALLDGTTCSLEESTRSSDRGDDALALLQEQTDPAATQNWIQVQSEGLVSAVVGLSATSILLLLLLTLLLLAFLLLGVRRMRSYRRVCCSRTASAQEEESKSERPN